IIYSQNFDKQIPWFIENQIGSIAKEMKGKFSVLIISPTRPKAGFIVKALKKKGFENIKFVEKMDEKPTLLDGFLLLLNDKKSNLGWRIVSKVLLEENYFISILKETYKDKAKAISEIVENGFKKEVNGMLKLFRAIKGDKTVDVEEFKAILRKIGYDPFEEAKKILKDEITSGSRRLNNPGLRKIPIKSTTIQSSKGLAADFVFITHFDDQYFIKNKDKTKISDQDICNFLVALTRARRKVFLISSNKMQEPTFLNWINEARIDKQGELNG
ncbi:MAG: 3'-5' exonuclease, partial [Desulfobaccales bacterium]